MPAELAAPRLVVIVGPTASGKTALAIRLAEAAGGEIVSVDSQQVYRGMDIGTGKASAGERARVPHHLLDVANPDEVMTAARWAELAGRAIAGIAARGRAVIVAGGTGLYVRALLYGLFPGPPADAALRARLAEDAAAAGVPALWERLQAVDAAAAARIDPNDLIRITRALEVHELTGRAISAHQAAHDFGKLAPRYPAKLVGLDPGREALRAAIDARVEDMLARGLVEEVRELVARGYRPELRAMGAIGYRETCQHLAGKLTREELAPAIQRAQRRYARRQLSWFRADPAVTWYISPAHVDVAALAAWLLSPQASRS